jgi:hypothetical protein
MSAIPKEAIKEFVKQGNFKSTDELWSAKAFTVHLGGSDSLGLPL